MIRTRHLLGNSRFFALLSLLFLRVLGLFDASAADPIQELQSFSAFSGISLEKLADGEILVSREASMRFARGISAQACFIVMAPAEKLAAWYPQWGTPDNEALKVYAHFPLHFPPSEQDFDSLDAVSQKKAFQWIVDRTREMTPGKSEFSLTHAEMAQLFKKLNSGGETAAIVTQSWKDFLKARASRFQKLGLAGLPLYESENATVSVESEIQSLLRERPKIQSQFASLLAESLQADPSSQNKPVYYWELAEANDHPAFDLGAVWIKSPGNRFQILDLTYYWSNDVYVSLALWQIWPIQVKGREASLVWIGEAVSSAEMAGLHGVERMAANALMAQELKKTARAFQENAAKVSVGGTR